MYGPSSDCCTNTDKMSGNITDNFLLGGNASDPNVLTVGPWDGRDKLMEDARALAGLVNQLNITRFVVWRILVPLTVLFGVIGNLLNVAVLTRRSMRTSTNVYLTALATCDILYLVFAFSLGLKHFQVISSSLTYKLFRKPFGMALVDTFSNTGVWLTLTFTVERYVGVCHPMKGKVLCTPQRARIIVAIVCTCTVILTFPEFFSFHSRTVVGENNVTDVVYDQVLEAYPSYQWGFKYLHQVLFTLGPLLTLLIFNTLLMRAVLHAAKQRRSMAKVAVVQNDKQDRHHREQQKITVMLIMVVVVFLLCQLPQAITNLYFTYLGVTDSLTEVLRYKLFLTANVCNLLVMINSSANFILYSAFSTKFRRTFKIIFCKCLLQRRTPDHLMSDIYSNDGSKANLILHAPHMNSNAPHRSPRHHHAATTTLSNLSNNSPSTNKTKTKNGYLEVNQTGKRIAAV